VCVCFSLFLCRCLCVSLVLVCVCVVMCFSLSFPFSLVSLFLYVCVRRFFSCVFGEMGSFHWPPGEKLVFNFFFLDLGNSNWPAKQNWALVGPQERTGRWQFRKDQIGRGSLKLAWPLFGPGGRGCGPGPQFIL